MLLAKVATAQSQEGTIILDVAKIIWPRGVSRVQQNCSSLANVSSLEDKGPFLNIVDDKERAGVEVSSKNERLEAMRSQLSTSRNLTSLGNSWHP